MRTEHRGKIDELQMTPTALCNSRPCFQRIASMRFPIGFPHVHRGGVARVRNRGWHLLKGRRDPMVKTMFAMALWLLLILAPVQMLGDQHGLNTRKSAAGARTPAFR
jgi:cytochrome bd-type quinol oxidase subunit 1